MSHLPVSRRRSSLIMALIAPWLAGCPVPIPVTVAPSAPVRGSVVRSDGRPLAGVEVVASTAYWPRECGRPVARTRTDAAGKFRLPATFEHHRVQWAFPGDRAAPNYYLCLPLQDTLRPVYEGWGALDAKPWPDSVRCVQWEWQNTTRITCSGAIGLLPALELYKRRIAEGGRWSEGSATGTYRVLLVQEPTRVSRKRLLDRDHVYVQWLEEDGVEAPYRVRATVQVGVDYRKITELAEPTICQHDEGWHAEFGGQLMRWWGDQSAYFNVALGPPGQVSDVEVGRACAPVDRPGG